MMMPASRPLPSPTDLSLLSNEEFAARWRALVGEPPAILLQDRAEMVRLLLESMAPAPCPPAPGAGPGAGLPNGQGAKSPSAAFAP